MLFHEGLQIGFCLVESDYRHEGLEKYLPQV